MNGMALGHILSRSLSQSEQHVAGEQRPTGLQSLANPSKNVNRLISAVVICPRFRALLFSDPDAALAAGYNGEQFHLTPAEYDAVISLRARTASDFAAELLRVLQYSAADTSPSRRDAEGQTEFRCAEVPT